MLLSVLGLVEFDAPHMGLEGPRASPFGGCIGVWLIKMHAWAGSSGFPDSSSALLANTQILAGSRRAGLLDLLTVADILAGILLRTNSKKEPNFAGIIELLRTGEGRISV
jgi:hypothetical protein